MPEDSNGEITELRDTLKEIEKNDLFYQMRRSLDKREAEDSIEDLAAGPLNEDMSLDFDRYTIDQTILTAKTF